MQWRWVVPRSPSKSSQAKQEKKSSLQIIWSRNLSYRVQQCTLRLPSFAHRNGWQALRFFATHISLSPLSQNVQWYSNVFQSKKQSFVDGNAENRVTFSRQIKSTSIGMRCENSRNFVETSVNDGVSLFFFDGFRKIFFIEKLMCFTIAHGCTWISHLFNVLLTLHEY